VNLWLTGQAHEVARLERGADAFVASARHWMETHSGYPWDRAGVPLLVETEPVEESPEVFVPAPVYPQAAPRRPVARSRRLHDPDRRAGVRADALAAVGARSDPRDRAGHDVTLARRTPSARTRLTLASISGLRSSRGSGASAPRGVNRALPGLLVLGFFWMLGSSSEPGSCDVSIARSSSLVRVGSFMDGLPVERWGRARLALARPFGEVLRPCLLLAPPIDGRNRQPAASPSSNSTITQSRHSPSSFPCRR
jgi:hypothetical protein